MLFQIMVMTVTGTVLTAANNRDVPYSNRLNGAINLENPTMRSLVIEDDDNRLDSAIYAPDEDLQRVHAALDLGSTIIAKGTQIGFHNGALIDDPAGNRFILMYPREFTPNALDGGARLTDGNTMLVIPLPKPDGSFPVFDPTANNFTFRGTYTPGEGREALVMNQLVTSTPDPAPDPTPDPEPDPGPVEDPKEPGDDDGPLCFAAGTLILTSTGPVAVERLRAGDLVVTRDQGVQPVLWTGKRSIAPADLDLSPNQRPIRIAKDALGPGQPARDLVVSPQHRILLRSPIVQRMFGEAEILVPARLLAGLPGISVQRDGQGVIYWHLLCRAHQVVAAEGAWTESLLPGPVALRAFGPALTRQIRSLVTPEEMTPARLLPPGRAVRALVERHLRNPRRRPVENDPSPAAAFRQRDLAL